MTLSRVLSNERVTALKHFQDTRLVRFEYHGKYDPGDVVNIHPVNNPYYVDLGKFSLGTFRFGPIKY